MNEGLWDYGTSGRGGDSIEGFGDLKSGPCRAWEGQEGGNTMARLSLIGIICTLVALMFTGQSYAEVRSESILGIWFLDEGVGDVTEDASGNGHDGTLMNGPKWIAGHFGNALDFSGSSSYVDCGNAKALNVEIFSISFWCYISGTQSWNHMISRGEHHGGGNPGAVNWGVMMYADQETILYEAFNDTVKPSVSANTTTGEWHHVVATHSGTEMELYHDGQSAGTSSTTGIMLDENLPLFIGAQSRANGPSDYFEGSIDDVGYFNIVLAPEDIEEIMNNGLAGITGGIAIATRPRPANGALHADTWITLSWKSGDFAISHDVYLGDDFDVVEQATPDSDVFRGNQVTDFYVAGFPGFAYPEGLVPGMTYYWRIDEINDLNPESPWKGDVWSFSIPPKTAYNPIPADGDGLASTTVTLSWTPGYGAKLHTIFLGDDFDEVSNATVGVPTGSPSYTPKSLEPEKVYYWRVDQFDGLQTYKGDVWAFTTPGAVGNPQPANGATDVGMATILSWTAADNAASHEIFFGVDKDTVQRADTSAPEYKGSKALGAESYDPGLLELGTTYYWRVDEIYSGNPVKGPVWSFTVGDYILIEDFENFTDNDADGQAIWQTWIDGFGVADNGAQVGYLLPPYAEQTIVHGGDQSMPLIYTNEAGVANSEAARTLTTLRDWTVASVEELTLWTRGDSANAAEPLYVAISNAAGAPGVVAHEDPSAATNTAWRQWRVSLQAFADQGINLGNVDKIAIGLGSQSGLPSAGGTGTMYIDDIRLYRP